MSTFEYDVRRQKRNDKTKVTTFRLSEPELAMLEKEAASERLTLSALVNHIISDHNEFRLLSGVSGIVPLQKRTLSNLINELDENQVRSLGKWMAQDLLDIMYAKGNGCTLTTFLETLLLWTRHSGFAYYNFIKDDVKAIIIRHDLGARWSALMINFLNDSIKALDQEATFENRDSMVVITIRNRAK
jgi:hypothetical protein